MLNAIGLPELITNDADEYEALALMFARDREKLQAVKQKLENNRTTYPLFDSGLFTQHLESAFKAMHEKRIAKLAPDHINIDP